MKLNQSMSILFWLYKQKADNSGVAPIYCRITLGEDRTQFSTAKRVHPDFWNSAANKVSVKCQDAAAINEDLDGIKGDLRKIFNQLTATHEAITGEMVKNAFTGKGQEKKTVIDLFDIYIAFYKQKVDQKKASYRTLQKFKTIQSKLTDFFKKEFRLSDKPLCELKASFTENFMHYLSVNENLCENTVMIYLRNAKQVFEFAVTRERVKSNPLKSFKCAYKHPYRETLSQDEITSLINCDLATRDLTEARDIFIFSCYTAFAYQEAYDLTPDCIVTGMDKKKWAVIVRQKTGEKEMVPLLPPALEIIEKYKNDARCIANEKLLPVRSNQEYNRVLKRVAKIAGIKKHLTTHIARHTFATTITMENDVPIETISKVMGHTSIRTTQIYTKVSLKKVSNNMNDLSAKLFPNKAGTKTGT